MLIEATTFMMICFFGEFPLLHLCCCHLVVSCCLFFGIVIVKILLSLSLIV